MCRRRSTICLILLVAALLYAGLLIPGEAWAKPTSNEKALSKVRDRIEALRKEIQQTQTLHDSARDELRTIERKMGGLYASLKQLNRKLATQRRKLADLQAQRRQLQADLANQHRLLSRQILAAFMIGRQDYLKLLLNQQDPAAVGRTMTYYDYFNRARVRRMDNVRATLQQLKQVEAAISVQTSKLNEVKQEQLVKQADLTKRSQDREAVIARLHRQLQGKEQELKHLVEDQQRLQDLVGKLDRAIPDILTAPGSHKPFARLRGKLIWPTKGKLLVSFGTRRAGGRLKWSGVLIRSSEGREVHAVSHGRVAYADWLRGYGLLMIIDHGNGYMSLYGHNQALYKETGEWVEAGEVIASVGKSGGQSQAGLYFEIRHNGRPVNPAKWCRGRPALAAYNAGASPQ